MPPVGNAAAAELPSTLDIHLFPPGINTPPSTLLMRGKMIGFSAHSDPTFVPPETQEVYTPALVTAALFLAPISFEFVTTGWGKAVGGGEEANTLGEGGGRPSNVANAILLPTLCPECTLVARIYDPFSLR